MGKNNFKTLSVKKNTENLKIWTIIGELNMKVLPSIVHLLKEEVEVKFTKLILVELTIDQLKEIPTTAIESKSDVYTAAQKLGFNIYKKDFLFSSMLDIISHLTEILKPGEQVYIGTEVVKNSHGWEGTLLLGRDDDGFYLNADYGNQRAYDENSRWFFVKEVVNKQSDAAVLSDPNLAVITA